MTKRLRNNMKNKLWINKSQKIYQEGDRVYKDIKDGRVVAVLYSPGYGAGWSTWNTGITAANLEKLIFHPDLVKLVLAEDLTNIENVVKELLKECSESVYFGGSDQLEITWVKEGTRFQIREYDGSESVEELGPDVGFIA